MSAPLPLVAMREVPLALLDMLSLSEGVPDIDFILFLVILC